MTQITVRNIPPSVEARLRTLAQQSGLSLNQTVVQLLEVATGGKRTDPRRRNLSDFTARWTAKEAEAFDLAMAVFEAVDAEVWR